MASQTLAAASGLHLDVPNVNQRGNTPLVSQMIDNADSVIVLLTRSALHSEYVTHEINIARSKNRTIIPIYEKGVASKAVTTLVGSPGFVFDPQKPWEMESELSRYLSKQVKAKESRNAILALAGTFAGLFLLSKLSEN